MDDDQRTRITLRIPTGLHDQLAQEADQANRSLNGEIVERLVSTFAIGPSMIPPGIRAAIAARAESAGTSFDVELLRAVTAGLDRKAPAVLIIEIDGSMPISKLFAVMEKAREQLPPDALVRLEHRA